MLLCAALPLAAWAVAWPGAEAGVIDDFSYTHMAKEVAATGRFGYDGWSTALVGAQAWWAAPAIRLCGFSFTVVRLSVLPLACAACGLVALLARRSGLPREDAIFVAALTGLSTPFLQLVPTFMTDLPSLCLLLASLAGLARGAELAAARPEHIAAAIGWLAVGTACGLVGGTIRQSVWLAVPAATATIAVLPGIPRRMRAAAVVCGVIGVAVLAAGIRWFARQPYAIPAVFPPLGEFFDPRAIAGPLLEIAGETVRKLLPAALFCLPWIVAECRSLAGHRRWTWAGVTGLILAAVIGATVAGIGEPLLAWAGGSWKTGLGPLHDAGIGLLRGTVILAAGAVTLAVTAAATRSLSGGGWRKLPALPPALLLPLVGLVPYMAALLLVARTSTGIFPRYFLPILPPLACGILMLSRGSVPRLGASAASRSAAGWLLVAFFAARGLAIVHDEFAETRSLLAAIAHLRGQGVPREQIASKWTIDGWEQVERAGFINDPRIRIPADAWRPDAAADYPDPKFVGRFPALAPRWHVTVRGAAEVSKRSDLPELSEPAASRSPRFPFTAWRRPPYRREVVIVPLPPRSAAADHPGG